MNGKWIVIDGDHQDDDGDPVGLWIDIIRKPQE